MPTIVTKYSTTAGSAPTALGMTLGELAVNVTDKKLYTKDNSANIVLVGADPTGSWTKILTQTASIVATIDFIHNVNGVVFDNTYDEYMFVLDRLKPATDNAVLWLRTTTNASSFDTGASEYRYSFSTTQSADQNGTDTKIIMTEGVGNVAATENGVSGVVLVNNPETATAALFLWKLAGWNASTAIGAYEGAGCRNTDADIDGVRFMYSTGNITSGTITMYGRRK